VVGAEVILRDSGKSSVQFQRRRVPNEEISDGFSSVPDEEK
jgi:hypothetical protein